MNTFSVPWGQVAGTFQYTLNLQWIILHEVHAHFFIHIFSPVLILELNQE